MHELSICQALVNQVEQVAREHHSTRVTSVQLRIGPLSGVEPHLLEQAFPLAAAGTVAEGSELRLDCLPVSVSCGHCGTVTNAPPNRLVCGQCGAWRTTLVSGDELQLARVELVRETVAQSTAPTAGEYRTQETE